MSTADLHAIKLLVKLSSGNVWVSLSDDPNSTGIGQEFVLFNNNAQSPDCATVWRLSHRRRFHKVFILIFAMI